jgi:uncharacterized protein Yka (UPF0111/DUF47 family)
MDDLFDKKKDTVQILDLSKTTANTKEEFKRLMEKVPDFKMRPVYKAFQELFFCIRKH